MSRHSFKPVRHIPEFSVILLKMLKAPLLVYFAIAGNIIMFVSAYCFFFFEKGINPQVETYWDALWWALCTISTVGYGDIVPITGVGRLAGAFLIIVGVVFFLGAMAVLTSAMVDLTNKQSNEDKL